MGVTSLYKVHPANAPPLPAGSLYPDAARALLLRPGSQATKVPFFISTKIKIVSLLWLKGILFIGVAE